MALDWQACSMPRISILILAPPFKINFPILGRQQNNPRPPPSGWEQGWGGGSLAGRSFLSSVISDKPLPLSRSGMGAASGVLAKFPLWEQRGGGSEPLRTSPCDECPEGRVLGTYPGERGEPRLWYPFAHTHYCPPQTAMLAWCQVLCWALGQGPLPWGYRC